MTRPIESYVRTIPDYPRQGILFRDVTTLIGDPEGFARAIDEMVRACEGREIDVVAAIEARGFIFGSAVARALGVGFVPIRKAGKLPSAVVGVDYTLEYGADRLEMHTDAVAEGAKVLLVDDLVATGGTATAALKLVRAGGGEVSLACFVVDLVDLGGADQLRSLGCEVHALCSFPGH